MTETVKAGEVRQRLGDLLDRVESADGQFVIERRGKPLAAIVSLSRYRQLERAAELELLSVFDRRGRQMNQRAAERLAREVKRRTR